MNLPQLLMNRENFYAGNLIHYYRIVWQHASNLGLPYHNYRHTFHVVYHCYLAAKFYGLNPIRTRKLLIGAMFHDHGHPGRSGNDDLNIEIAIRALRLYAHPSDIDHLDDIAAIIRSTQYPHIEMDLSLEQAILRDADVSQALMESWVQHVIFGLAAEMRLTPLQVFRMQKGFLSNLKFNTEWAQLQFPQALIDDKIAEAELHLEMLS